MEDFPAAIPLTTYFIDGASSPSGKTKDGNDILSNEEIAFTVDIENEIPNKKCASTKQTRNILDREIPTIQESSGQPKTIKSPDDAVASALLNSSLTEGTDPLIPRPLKKNLVLHDDNMKSPQREQKHSDTLQIKETPVTENEIRNMSPKRHDRKDHGHRDTKSPRRGDSLSPKPQSRTPKALSKTPMKKDAKLPMMLPLDDDAVNDLFSLTSKLLSGSVAHLPTSAQNLLNDTNRLNQEDTCTFKMESLYASLEGSGEDSAKTSAKVTSDVINEGGLKDPPKVKITSDAETSDVTVREEDDRVAASKEVGMPKELDTTTSNVSKTKEERPILVPVSTADRYCTPDRRSRDKSIRRRRSNSLPPQESRNAVVLPALAQTPLRRSQKWVDIALAVSCSPEKPPRQNRKKYSEANGSGNKTQPLEELKNKSPKRDGKLKEQRGDPPSKSPRPKSDDSGSKSPKGTPLKSKKLSLEQKTQNEKWPLMLPMDEDDFAGTPLVPCSSDKQKNGSMSLQLDSDNSDVQQQTTSIVAPLSQSEKLLAQKSDIECKVDDFVDAEVEYLELSVDSPCEANILQMSAVVASMDEGMAKVWARFDDQLHRSTQCAAPSKEGRDSDQSSAVARDLDGIDLSIVALDNSPLSGKKEADCIDETITAPRNISSSVYRRDADGMDETITTTRGEAERISLNDTPFTGVEEGDSSGQLINVPCDPPSSEMKETKSSSENAIDRANQQHSCSKADTTSPPVLYSMDDSRLSPLQKVLVVDLWSDASENVMMALNELLVLDMKTTAGLLQMGGHLALIVSLRKWRACATIQTLIFRIVHKAADLSTEFADAIVGLGALDLILCSMKHFAADEDLVSDGCGALLNLTSPAKHARVFVFELNGIQTVASASGRFPSNVSLQKYTLWMIQYFSYWDDFKAPIVQAGGMQALAKMIETFSHRNDDAAAMETILKSASATMKRLL
jgi:hypothetical protein